MKTLQKHPRIILACTAILVTFCICPSTIPRSSTSSDEGLSKEIAEAPTDPPAEEPTEAPTEEPTEAPVEAAPLNPLLTGNFTTCDNIARYVNFTFAENHPPYDPATVRVLFNGQEATCTPAASNSTVLTCVYPPAPYGPPAIIEVFIGEERVNEFNFDGGSVCNPAPQPNNPDPDPTEDPNTGPAATEPPSG